jgi:hypothetical protein
VTDRTSRGCVIGLLLSVVFWAAVITVWMLA